MKTLTAFLLVLLLCDPLQAAELQGRCSLVFSGSSTLHDFEGTGACRPFVLRLGPGGTASVPEGIEVAVSGLETNNATRDESMRKMFQADAWPLIHAAVAQIDFNPALARLRAGGNSEPLGFILKIRDVERPVQGRITHFTQDGDDLVFDLDFTLSLKAFSLKAPSVLGLIRVADSVTVTVRIHLAGS